MKRVVIILEGASESGDAELRSDTPLHAARMPTLDALARHARLGTAGMAPEDRVPGAEVSLAATLGIDPLRYPIGRGPAEALAYGLEIGRSDALLRASLVTIDGGILSDWAPEPLRLAEVRGFLHAINADAPEGAEVLCGDGHRCILAVRNSTACRAVQTLSPVEVMGKPVRAHLPFGRGSRALAKWMQQAMTRLEGHELNHIRADLGEPEVTGVWFWGAGEIPRIPSWRDRFGVGGELITASALMQGIGRVARLDVEAWQPRPRDRGEETASLASRTVLALDRRDFVCVHTDWPDYAGHRGDRDAKIAAIETCDAELIRPVVARLAQEPGWRLLVTTAHSTATATRVHSASPAPLLIAGPGIESNRGEAFDEANAAAGEIRLERGSDLMEYFLARA